MAYLIGAALALAMLLLARRTGLDRNRLLYPLMLIVTASCYELFAAIGGPASALWTEAAVMALFIAAYVAFRESPWVIVIGMAAHGLFDALHPLIIDNAGVPSGWPAFCLAFDFVAAALIATWLMMDRRTGSLAEPYLALVAAPGTPLAQPSQTRPGTPMRRSPALPLSVLALLGLTTAASLWASTVPSRPLAGGAEYAPHPEKIDPYRARFGRSRPMIAIVGENSATELTDFVIPHGILAEADVADVVTLSTKPGVMTMRPSLRLQPDMTVSAFDERHPEGADYVIVPAVVNRDDPTLLAWIARQSSRGATIVSICDGALVVANTGLMNGHRATAHWATLAYRRETFQT
jgi:hypothetical protein